MEIWKDVVNYEGFYQISSFGNVKSLSRNIIIKNGKYVYSYPIKEKFLKQSIDAHGYLCVNLCKDATKNFSKIHQLVAIAFLNHTPCGYKYVVNHKDINKLNNNLDNLEIVTARENLNQKHLQSSSSYVGVTWDKSRNKWKSHIRINYKTINLGRFDDEIEASQAYQNALNKISL